MMSFAGRGGTSLDLRSLLVEVLQTGETTSSGVSGPSKERFFSTTGTARSEAVDVSGLNSEPLSGLVLPFKAGSGPGWV